MEILSITTLGLHTESDKGHTKSSLQSAVVG